MAVEPVLVNSFSLVEKFVSLVIRLCVDGLRDLHLNDNAFMDVFLKILIPNWGGRTFFLQFYINLFCVKKIMCNFAQSKKMRLM